MIEKMIEQGLEAVDRNLSWMIASDVKLLEEAGRHIVTSGGKRIRPRLTMLAYLAAGAPTLDAVIPMAAAVELVHTATLVHDDINDHSTTRRGKDTVHVRWGRTFALLTGDYLFAKVYEMMAPYGADYNRLMSGACVRLVEGETLQAAAAKAGQMDRETYKTIISRKTASLFEVGARMAAMLAGADEKVIAGLSEYAYNMGLTFQIVDDILDIIGDPETMGKPVGSDLAQGRGVMVTQNGRKMGGHDGPLATAVTEAPEHDPVQAMMTRLRESGAVEVARLQALETAQRARQALAAVPDSAARDVLMEMVDLVIEREQ